MPLYQYECEVCHLEEEHQVSIQERDTEFTCPNCGGKMTRQVTAAKIGREKVGMGVILSDGSRVRGHFGREAPRARKKGG
ncbi:MAG: FmdB family zinc ribbon protein [Lentisphaeria bacterium]